VDVPNQGLNRKML